MKTTWFVFSLLGFSVSAAVVILLLPSLFRSGSQDDVWAVWVAACLAAVFAAGALYWRPASARGR